MKTLSIIYILLCLIPTMLFGQGIRGKISNTSGEPLPYATIFIKDLSMGTTSNSEGLYEIKMPIGTFEVQYRNMGYVPFNTTAVISDSSFTELNVVLPEQMFQLQQINVYASKENPAYPIMRRAISMSPYYLNQIKSYNADLYLKGTVRLDKVPQMLAKRLNLEVDGVQLKVKEGALIVGESFNQIKFTAPDNYQQKIISSNISTMDNQSQTFNLGLITASPYQPHIDYVITPFSPQAFTHYKFSLVGSFTDNGYLVNKIKVTPKRESKQLVSGYLFIIDGLWSIHSLEFTNQQIFGTINIKMIYNEMIDGIWLPISHNISVNGKMMGMKGVANYTSSVKYKDVIVNTELETPALLADYYEDQAIDEEFKKEELNRRQKQIDKLMQKERLTNREAIRLTNLMDKEMKASRDSTKSLEIKDNYKIEKSDSLQKPFKYWTEMRPNPLTAEELQVLESSNSIQSSQADTIQNNHQKELEPVSKIIMGGNWQTSDSLLRLNYGGLICPKSIGFNAVEGFKYGQKLEWSINPSKTGIIQGNLNLDYGFSNREFQWEHLLNWNYDPLKMSNLWINTGHKIEDINEEYGVTPFVNAMASLLFKKNYARYEEKQFIELGHIFEVTNGLKLGCELGYYDRKALNNSTNFSFFRRDETYHANQINSILAPTAQLRDSRASIVGISVEYTPQQVYMIRDGVKIARWGKWPTFTATYQRAQKDFLGGNASWDKITAQIAQRVRTGAYSRFNYLVKGGKFLTSENLPFSDFIKISTTESPIEMGDPINKFRLLPQYNYNINNWYAEGHITYLAPYLALKYLPGLSNTVIREQIHFKVLILPELKNYCEVGYSLSDIGSFGEIGVFAGFDNGKYSRFGISAAIDF